MSKKSTVDMLRFAGDMVSWFVQLVFKVTVVLMMISIPYKGVQLSYEHLPTFLHIVVLVLYALVLAAGLRSISTQKMRSRSRGWISTWFGPSGLVVFPAILLATSAAVFSSLTLLLHNNEMVELQECSGRAVSQGSLMDFYVWHFMKLVPFLKINDVLKWAEPLCYTQSRVGFFILLYQGFVVLPTVATVRFYFANRSKKGDKSPSPADRNRD